MYEMQRPAPSNQSNSNEFHLARMYEMQSAWVSCFTSRAYEMQLEKKGRETFMFHLACVY